VAFSLASRGWDVTVLDQASEGGAGASGLPVGLAAPHVSPDDNLLSRITRAGVKATLHRAQALLISGSDWALSGVLEHNLGGKRRLPAADPHTPKSDADKFDPSTPASPAQIAAAGLPPGSPALWHAHAGWLRPRQLVAAQLKTPGVQVRWVGKHKFDNTLTEIDLRPSDNAIAPEMYMNLTARYRFEVGGANMELFGVIENQRNYTGQKYWIDTTPKNIENADRIHRLIPEGRVSFDDFAGLRELACFDTSYLDQDGPILR
jgi:hypothetical protein